MNLMTVLEMGAAGFGDRVICTTRSHRATADQLLQRARAGSSLIKKIGAAHVAYVGVNHLAFPVALFSGAWAGVPFLPLNYRLSDEQLHRLLANHEDVLVIADDQAAPRLRGLPGTVITVDELIDRTAVVPAATAGSDGVAAGDEWNDDPEAIAVILYTSGTTSEPKAAVLRHRHLLAYLLGSLDFASADETDATLVSVPPYHIAGVTNLLSNLYTGRRVVYVEAFDAGEWLEIARAEAVTHAMVVPTMLARIVDRLGEAPGAPGATLPTLRSLAYGGARMPSSVVERALELMPTTDFVNAYGLTETSSTIAVLGPEDHRKAMEGGDPASRKRLGSAGLILPGVEIEVRDEEGRALSPDHLGSLWVRGEQVAGEYLGRGSQLDAEGWFPTGDQGWVDEEGYLFVEGRADDTIIRGGENIAPAEIEDVITRHPAVEESAVVGVPDDEWGQRIVAAVVLRPNRVASADEIREWVRERLRGSKTPDEVMFRSELPHTDTGKLLRRQLLAELMENAST